MTENNLVDKKERKDIKKIMSKIERIFQEKRGFSKLPLFSDNISDNNFNQLDLNTNATQYESNDVNENQDTIDNDNTTNTDTIEGFETEFSSILEYIYRPVKNPKDIADFYLNNELKEQKLAKDDRDASYMKKSKKDKYCESTFYMGQIVQLRSELKNENPKKYQITTNDIKKRKVTITQLPPLEDEEKPAPKKENIPYDDITQATIGFEFTSIPKYIYSVFIYIHYGLQKSIIKFTELTSDLRSQYDFMTEEEKKEFKENLKHDQEVLIENMYKILNILLIVFITYNWFFVFFYKDEYENIIKYYQFDPNDVNKRGDVARFFLEFAYFPFCVFTSFLTNKESGMLSFPNISNFISSNVVLFLGLFLLIYFNFDKLSYFATKLTNGHDSSYIIYFLTLFGIFAGTSEPSEEWNQTLEFYNKYYIGFIVWLFRAIITMFMLPYVNISIGFYLLYSSLFSIFHDTYVTKKANNVFDNISKMLYFNTKMPDECEFDDSCLTNYDRLIRLCKQIYNMFVNNFSFVVIITIILSSFNSFFNMKNENIRLSSNIVLIFIIFTMLTLNINANNSSSGQNNIYGDGSKIAYSISSTIFRTIAIPIATIISMLNSLLVSNP